MHPAYESEAPWKRTLKSRRAAPWLSYGRDRFGRYIIGSAISDTGSWMQVFAQGYVMSLLTTKAVYLGFANLAAGLPMLALTMIGGAAADRFDKRRILLITQYVQIALALGLGSLIYTNRIADLACLRFRRHPRRLQLL